jgi:hypothetical protein
MTVRFIEDALSAALGPDRTYLEDSFLAAAAALNPKSDAPCRFDTITDAARLVSSLSLTEPVTDCSQFGVSNLALNVVDSRETGGRKAYHPVIFEGIEKVNGHRNPPTF